MEIEIDKSIIGRDSDEVMKEKNIKDISDLCDYVDSCGGTICSGVGGCSRCMRVEDFLYPAPDGNNFVCNECREKMEKELKLPCYGIVVTLTDIELHAITPNRYGGGSITSDLKEDYPLTHKDILIDEYIPEEKKEIEMEIDLYNSAMDALESMILSHAIAGIDITTPAYLEGIETAVQGCANNI